MADNDAKILKALEDLQADVTGLKKDVSSIKTEHGKKIDILLSGQSHIETAIKTLATKRDVEKVKEEVDEIKKGLHPRRAD